MEKIDKTSMNLTQLNVRGGCGQILGPCYFKLVPDFACTP